MNKTQLNSLTYAYIGDAIYELLIREYLIEKGLVKVKELQSESLKYVSATRQAYFLDELIKKNIFSEEELQIIKTARNSKTNSKPKSCDILTYKHATALEALFGYLYLNEDKKRIEKLIKEIETL